LLSDSSSVAATPTNNNFFSAKKGFP